LHMVGATILGSTKYFCEQRGANSLASNVTSHVNGFDFCAQSTSVLEMSEIDELCHGDNLTVTYGDDHFSSARAGKFLQRQGVALMGPWAFGFRAQGATG